MTTESDTTPDRHVEAELMIRVAARDQQAFAELTEKYSALIFATAFKVLNHYEDTEDIMNEVLATIWKKADTYHPKQGSLVTWICTTTRNRAIDRVRSVQRRCALYDRFEEKVEGDAPEYSLTGREALYLSDARTILQSAVVALSPEQRAAYDKADKSMLRDVMTTEMFAEVSTDLAARATHQPTEIVTLAAEIVEVTTENDSHWASVRFTGLLRDDGAETAQPFDEVWNLKKPVTGDTGWLLAGIQQL